MQTAGLVEFLGRDGYEVRHFFARYPGWGIGRVDGDGYLRGGDSETFGGEDGGVGDPRRTEGGADGGETFGRADGGVGDPRRTPGSEAIEFAEGEWNVATIRERFRAAVERDADERGSRSSQRRNRDLSADDAERTQMKCRNDRTVQAGCSN